MGTVGKAVTQLAVLVVLARLLLPAEFGLISAAMVVVGFLKIFSELGVGPAVVQRKNLTNQHIGTANILAVGTGFVFGVLLFLSSGAIADFFRMPALAEVVKLLSFSLPLSGFTVVGMSLLQRHLKFRKIIAFTFFSHLLSSACIAIPLAYYGLGVWALAYAQIGFALLNVLFVFIGVPECRSLHFEWSKAKDLLSYGVGHSIAKTANYFAGQGDNMIVARFMGAEALGLYGRAYQLISVPAKMVGGTMDKVLFPILSNIQDDNLRVKRAYLKAVSIVAMVSMPLSGFLIIMAEEIVFTLLGRQWGEIIPAFQILAIILVFRMSYKLSDSLVRSKGAVYRRAWRQLIYALLVFVGAWGGHFYGIHGVATGVALAIVVNFLLMLQLSKALIMFKWTEMLKIHVTHLWITLILMVTLFSVKNIAKPVVSSDLLILLLAFGAALLSLVSLWWMFRGRLNKEIDYLLPLVVKGYQKFRAYV